LWWVRFEELWEMVWSLCLGMSGFFWGWIGLVYRGTWEFMSFKALNCWAEVW
jgi:hypothetical protein